MNEPPTPDETRERMRLLTIAIAILAVAQIVFLIVFAFGVVAPHHP
jgi:hypothetical protein